MEDFEEFDVPEYSEHFEDFEDFEDATEFDKYNIITREKLLRSLDEEWNNVVVPCKVYSKWCDLEPFYHNGMPIEDGHRFFETYTEDAFFTGDGYIVFAEPDWMEDSERKPEPIKIIDGKPYYSRSAIGFDGDYTLCPFEANGNWGYFDFRSGEVILGPQFGFCDCFTYNSETVRFNMLKSYLEPDADFDENIFPNHKDIPNGKWGAVEYNYGEILSIPPIYQYLTCWHNDVIVAKKNNHWGILDYSEKFEWDDMWLDWRYSAIGKKITDNGARYSVLDSKGKELIGGLTGFPHMLPVGEEDEDEDGNSDGGCYTARYFKNGDKYGVIDCFGSYEEPEKARIVLASEPILTFEEAKKLIIELEKHH